MIIQTAVAGEADVLCTRDKDVYTADPVAFLEKTGTTVMDDIVLMHRLRS